MKRIGAAATTLVAAAIGAALLSGCVASSPKPSPPTDKEVDAYVSRMLDQTWKSSGLEGVVKRPRVKVGAVESVDESSNKLTECYADAGYELNAYSWSDDEGYQLIESTNVFVDDPDKQLAFYTCLARHPVDPVESGALVGTGQLAYQYDHFVNWVIPCLRASGYSLDYVPTRAEFLESGGYFWGPYSSVENIDTPQKYDSLTALCGPERVEF